MAKRRWSGALLVLAAGSVIADASPYRQFAAEQLVQGRTIWLENCEGCHGYGTAGAPIPMVADDWRERLKKPRPVLYRHAIDGFFGPDDAMMPPRGGNDSLTDNEVRAAVDYMAALAHSYQETTEHTQ
jgi:cytochrome c5